MGECIFEKTLLTSPVHPAHKVYIHGFKQVPPLTQFTPFASTIGGMLIGLAAVMLMLGNGRIAGMTGIFAGLLVQRGGDWQWRAAFIAGAIAAPMLYVFLTGRTIELNFPVSPAMMVIGGLMVGVGVTYGSGCTSGHGVCGMARFSRRSFVATCVFMAATFATVYVVRHVIGS
jgi:uncharacterized membrane protein YedE/YeeE